jgi:Tfp pilus assembly protein PilF
MYDSAISLLQEAIKRVPQNQTYHYHLALAYQKSNQTIHAKASFQHALDLDPSSPRALEIRHAMTELSTNQ